MWFGSDELRIGAGENWIQLRLSDHGWRCWVDDPPDGAPGSNSIKYGAEPDRGRASRTAAQPEIAPPDIKCSREPKKYLKTPFFKINNLYQAYE